jgi:AcrR family transcriptional regulator
MNRPLPPDQAPAAENLTCDRILEAAFNSFIENGYAGTSTLEIATRAKVSKRDLYAKFRNKQAILVTCIATWAARVRLSPDLGVPRSREMLTATLVSFGASVVREVSHPAVIAMFRLAIAEAKRSPEIAETLSASRSVNRGALAELLGLAQASGILARGDPQQMTERYFALLWGDLMLNRLLGTASSPSSAEIDQRARDATEAFLKIFAAQV